MTVLIPAYKPDESLIETVKEIREQAPEMDVVVIDDGGKEAFAEIFSKVRELGATVLVHEENRGKGAGLKTGFAYLLEKGEQEGCVTADADGQHLTKDIIKVAQKVRENPDALVIGGRKFNRPGVPLRSKAGNYATRFTYNLLCGQCLGDTQTGLRGIPASRLADMLTVPGDRYEYEMGQLLMARQMDLPLVETEIETVYRDVENSTSHFNPLQDAMRVYKPVIVAGLGLILAAAIDIALFLILYPTLGLIASAFIARGVSFAVRSADLLIRRKGRRLKIGKVADYVAFAVFSVAFTTLFAFAFGPSLPVSEKILKLLAELFLVAYICVINAIKIRRVK